MEKYRDRLVHAESRKDNGQGHAINLGFAHARGGEIMAYLNSDDLLMPGSLNYVAAYFAANPDVDVVYGHRVIIDPNGQEIGRWILPSHSDQMLIWADYVPQETMFWRRRIWDKAGGKIDEAFQFALDWDLLLRFREAGAKIRPPAAVPGCIPRPRQPEDNGRSGGHGNARNGAAASQNPRVSHESGRHPAEHGRIYAPTRRI